MPANRPLVSVIVPAYNCEQFVGECLQSILGQSYRDIELICVNDGSTDGTGSVLKKFAERDPRIIVVEQPNKGEGAARNSGLDKAHGDFLAFFDADDIIDGQYVEKMVSAAEKHTADIAICSVDSYNEQTGEVLPVPWGCIKDNFPSKVFSYADNPNMLFQSFQNWTWNKLFRTSFVKRHNLRFHEIQRSADLYFVMCALALADRMVATREVLYRYRVNNPTSNIATSDRAPLDFCKSFIEVKRRLLPTGRFEAIERSFQNWVAESMLYNLRIMRSPQSFEELRSYLVSTGCPELGIDGMEKRSYYSEAVFDQIQHLLEDNASEFLFAQYRYTNLLLEQQVNATTRAASEYDKARLSIGRSGIQLAKAIARAARNTCCPGRNWD